MTEPLNAKPLNGLKNVRLAGIIRQCLTKDYTRAVCCFYYNVRSFFDTIITKHSRACSVWYTGTQGDVGGRIKLTQVSGTGTESVPNLTGISGRVLRPHRTLQQGSVGYIPIKHPRYTLVRIYLIEHNLGMIALSVT